jgi:hypothetical protein
LEERGLLLTAASASGMTSSEVLHWAMELP